MNKEQDFMILLLNQYTWIKWKIEVNKKTHILILYLNGIPYLLGHNPYTDIPYTIDTKTWKINIQTFNFTMFVYIII